MPAEDGFTSESALVLLVPESEYLVSPFRERYDPSASDGMPAHITINYPFTPLWPNWYEVILALEELFDQFSQFSFMLAEVHRFPDVLYLGPVPEQPFQDMIAAVKKRFPESPPYSGRIGEIVPHLTVAQIGEKSRLDAIAEDFRSQVADQLPIHARAESVWLMDNRRGEWEAQYEFLLGSPPPAGI
jgi:2'-5' RNA ligase